MKTTPAQTKEIVRWGNQHRQMLRANYRRQFVAYSATRLLAAVREMSEPSDLWTWLGLR